MPTSPLVLEPAPTPSGLLQWLLHHHAGPAHLVVCTDRVGFLEQLQASLGTLSDRHNPEEELQSQSLLTPTLLNIAASQNVKLAFITSVPALLAYLTVLPHKQVKPDQNEKEALLILLNPLALHQDSSYWSAQGTSRTIALAVETAWKLEHRLMILECEPISKDGNCIEASSGVQDGDTAMTDRPASIRVVGSVAGDENEVRQDAQARPWDQHIPILSPGVRTFGAGIDRSWTQKSVKVRDVARKWCLFGSLPKT